MPGRGRRRVRETASARNARIKDRELLLQELLVPISSNPNQDQDWRASGLEQDPGPSTSSGRQEQGQARTRQNARDARHSRRRGNLSTPPAPAPASMPPVVVAEERKTLRTMVKERSLEIVQAARPCTPKSVLAVCSHVADLVTSFVADIKAHYKRSDEYLSMDGTVLGDCVFVMKALIILSGLPADRNRVPLIGNLTSFMDDEDIAAHGTVIVRKCCKVLKLLMKTDPRVGDVESKAFCVFKDVFLPNDNVVGLMTVFNLMDEREQIQIILPVGYKYILKFITDSLIFCKQEFLYPETKRLFSGALPSLKIDSKTILDDCRFLAIELVQDVFYPNVGLGNNAYGMENVPRIETVELLAAVISVTPFDQFDPMVFRDLNDLADDMFKSEVEAGVLPFYSLHPVSAMLIQKHIVPTVMMQFCIVTSTLEEMNSFARSYSNHNNLKYKKPLKNFLRDVNVPPIVAIPYTFLIIMERQFEDWGSAQEYVNRAGSAFMTKSWEIIEPIFLNHSYVFRNTVEVVIDMANILIKRLHSALIQNELSFSSKEAAIKCSSFGRSIVAVQHGLHCIEKVLTLGREPNTPVPVLMRKVLELGNNLDRIKSPYINCCYLDAIGEIGVGIAGLFDAELARDVIRRVMNFRVIVEKTIPSGAEEVSAKAGRAAGKLVQFPSRMVTDTGSLNLLFREGFAQLNKTSGKYHHINVRLNWAWALAELTQTLGTLVKNGEYVCSNDAYIQLLQHCATVITGASKGRFNGFRAAGNIFSFVNPTRNENEKEAVNHTCVLVLRNMIDQLGVSVDYKNRWNAAYGLGCVFGNDALVAYISKSENSRSPGNIKDEILYSLAMWAYKSQNYKERIQCLHALSKISSRAVFGDLFEEAVIGICKSIMYQPSEGNELKTKLQVTAVVALCSCLSHMGVGDIKGDFLGNAVVPFMDVLGKTFHEVHDKVAGYSADKVFKARDRLQALQHSETQIPEIIPWLIDHLTRLSGVVDVAEGAAAVTPAPQPETDAHPPQKFVATNNKFDTEEGEGGFVFDVEDLTLNTEYLLQHLNISGTTDIQ